MLRVVLEAGRDDPAALLPDVLGAFRGLDGVARDPVFEAGRALEDERGAGFDAELGAGFDCELGAGRGFAEDDRLPLEAGRRALDEDDEEDERFADDGAEELERLALERLFPERSI